jgi:predicted nucleotidyltransferase
MISLKEKFDSALRTFVEKHKKNPNVVGILVSGSYIHSKPDKNSDLDVSIVLKDSKTRTRGNTWVNGVEIEYFINPVRQIKHYIKTEVGDISPATAHMFANSLVLYNKGKIMDELIKEAKKSLKKPREKLKKFQIENGKYHLDDLEKDLEDVFLRKSDFSFNYVSMQILNESLDLFYKIKRVQGEKSKRIHSQLRELDAEFANLYNNALNETNKKKKYNHLRKLVRYVEHHLGGKRSKEWILTGKCTC